MPAGIRLVRLHCDAKASSRRGEHGVGRAPGEVLLDRADVRSGDRERDVAWRARATESVSASPMRQKNVSMP